MATVLPRPSRMFASRDSVSGSFGYAVLTPLVITSVAILAPILTLLIIAFSGNFDDWAHLTRNVLPRSTATTFLLLALVAMLSASVGVLAAWFVNAFEFPLRRTLSWMLVLPLAIPPYLAAYALGEFFHFTGPVQTLIREMFGFQSARDYWFPDIRSTGGAAVVLASVLYPYVYLTTRIVFLMQGRNLADVARTLGSSPVRVFMNIQIPVARPAIVAGLVLVMMETLNDIGAVEYLGVKTLTFSVYNTWLNRGSLEGAAQIACGMLILVMMLIGLEQWARRKQRFHSARSVQMRHLLPRIPLPKTLGLIATFLCIIPILIGFAVPLWVLAGFAIKRTDQLWEPSLISALFNSITVASLTALLAISVALILANAVRIDPRPRVKLISRLAVVGYALPGTILGIGLLVLLATFDRYLNLAAIQVIGERPGLVFTGTAIAVVYACTLRFLAVADSSIQSGIHKLPHDIDPAARLLGDTSFQAARRILIPLLRPAIFTAGIIVFVDTIKELSATILLRPFGYNTLSTLVYENASRGAVEDGAVAAMLIVAAAVIPVILLAKALANDRDV